MAISISERPSLYSVDLLSMEEELDEFSRKFSTDLYSEYSFDTHDESKYKGMVKDHYKSTDTRSSCPQCNKKFTVKLRPHHCRRCGEIYCMKCLCFKRKLNQLATLDPHGKPRKVCKSCFNKEGFTLGCTRSLKDEFFKERQNSKHERVLRLRYENLTSNFWRDQIEMEKECRRLLYGFAEAIGTSEAKKTLQELRQLVKPPKWQKSSFWKREKSVSNCRACNSGFGLRKKKTNCKVCGLALCKRCSDKELLLYVDDGQADETRARSKLGVIKFEGCPEKEPDISLLLHICKDCKEYVKEQQTTTPTSDSLSSLIHMDELFTTLQNRISPSINQCEEMLDSPEVSQNVPNLNRLSNCLEQLNRELDDYESLFHKLRKLKETSSTITEKNLFENYTKAKYDFYMSIRHTYRGLRRRDESNKSYMTSTKTDTKSDAETPQEQQSREQFIANKLNLGIRKDTIEVDRAEMETETYLDYDTLEDKSERRSVASVKRKDSFFDRKLRLGSLIRRKSKQLRSDSETKEDEEIHDNIIGEPANYLHSEECKTETTKCNIHNSNESNFTDWSRPDDLFTEKKDIYKDEMSVIKEEGHSGVNKSTTVSKDESATSIKMYDSNFDRMSRAGSFFRSFRKSKKSHFMLESETEIIDGNKNTVLQPEFAGVKNTGCQFSVHQAIENFKPIIKEMQSDIGTSASNLKETKVNETLKTEKTAHIEEQNYAVDYATNRGENTNESVTRSNSFFDKRFRPGSFKKRKPKENQIRSESEIKSNHNEADATVFIESNENTDIFQPTIDGDQNSGTYSIKDFTNNLTDKYRGANVFLDTLDQLKPLENSNNEKLQIENRERLMVDKLITVAPETNVNTEKRDSIIQDTNIVKRNNSFFDRSLRPGSFMKRKSKLKTVLLEEGTNLKDDKECANHDRVCSIEQIDLKNLNSCRNSKVSLGNAKENAFHENEQVNSLRTETNTETELENKKCLVTGKNQGAKQPRSKTEDIDSVSVERSSLVVERKLGQESFNIRQAKQQFQLETEEKLNESEEISYNTIKGMRQSFKKRATGHQASKETVKRLDQIIVNL